MASLQDVYCKFGEAAEAGQLFETELGTLLLGARGAERGWHVQPEPDIARKVWDEIERQTLGALLKDLKKIVVFDDEMVNKFALALKARNRLVHGFFERHNFGDLTDEGRDKMLAELDALHQELHGAWQLASAMTDLMLKHIMAEREKASPDT